MQQRPRRIFTMKARVLKADDPESGTKLKDSTKGTVNELRAINEFLKQGCVVCKNVEAQGPFDISVTFPNGKVELLDVKTNSLRKRDGLPIHRSLSATQKGLGVKFWYKDASDKGHYHPPKGKREKKNPR